MHFERLILRHFCFYKEGSIQNFRFFIGCCWGLGGLLSFPTDCLVSKPVSCLIHFDSLWILLNVLCAISLSVIILFFPLSLLQLSFFFIFNYVW